MGWIHESGVLHISVDVIKSNRVGIRIIVIAKLVNKQENSKLSRFVEKLICSDLKILL